MMKPRGILVVILVVTLAAGAVAAQTWQARYAAPRVLSVRLSADDCAAGVCSADVFIAASPATAADAAHVGRRSVQWVERHQWTTAQLLALLSAACVVSDGDRPAGFARTLPVCP